jgi:photosystem II stability/assembly factor-like uncharacterized protein
MKLLAAAFLVGTSFAQSWMPQTSNTNASLRGLSAVDEKTVWASGSGGTYLRTIDGGVTWTAASVAGAESLDFRGVRAIDARTAYLMSSGPGEKSRIYKTTNAGESWTLQFTHPDPKGFLNSIAFWDADHGIVVGDALEGTADIRTTEDGGAHWLRRKTPPALPNEGSFAASNTCLFLAGKGRAWFVTGGAGAARVFRSEDGGGTWSVAATPMRNDGASAGIFSIAFSTATRGMVVGGDYAKDKEDLGNIALSSDGGRSWIAPGQEVSRRPESRVTEKGRPGGPPHGFRSAVAWVPERKVWIATGTSGSDISRDDGGTWTQFDEGSYNALSVAPGGAVWAAGARGRIARLAWTGR